MSATLNPGQLRAVEHGSGPMLVLAGPGSGKTRVVTMRAARLVERGVEPSRILLVTFTRKAATEMQARIGKLVGHTRAAAIWVGTFHSTCAKLLRSLYNDSWRKGRSRDFIIYDPDDGKAIVRAAIDELGLDRKEFDPKETLAIISRIKGEGKSVEDELTSGEDSDKAVVAIARGYEKALERADAYDYDDLLTIAMELAEGSHAVGTAWRKLFTHVIVDEYQDTNSVQFRLVNALGASRNLCVVGDHRQSIYRFRGADWRNIELFRKEFPDAVEVNVDINYRSCGHIVGCFNSLFDDCTMTTPNEPGPLVTVSDHADGEQEAGAVTRHVLQQLAAGTPASELAVLYRVHTLSRPLEEQFNRAGINYQIAGGPGFYDRSEVRNVLAYLRLAVNPESNVDAERVINLPRRKLGHKVVASLRDCALQRGCSLYQGLPLAPGMERFPPLALKAMGEFYEMIEQARDKLDSLSLTDVVGELVERTGLADMYLSERANHLKKKEPVKARRAERQAERVDEVVAAVAGYERRVKKPTLGGYLEQVALITAQDELAGEKVSLLTIHAAKGMEYDSVWVVGAEKGLLPFVKAVTDDDIAEERRLMFVACSRARQWLTLSYANERFLYGKWDQRKPSQFLDALPEQDRRWADRDAPGAR